METHDTPVYSKNDTTATRYQCYWANSRLIILSALKAAFYVGGEKQWGIFKYFCIAVVKREKL